MTQESWGKMGSYLNQVQEHLYPRLITTVADMCRETGTPVRVSASDVRARVSVSALDVRGRSGPPIQLPENRWRDLFDRGVAEGYFLRRKERGWFYYELLAPDGDSGALPHFHQGRGETGCALQMRPEVHCTHYAEHVACQGCFEGMAGATYSDGDDHAVGYFTAAGWARRNWIPTACSRTMAATHCDIRNWDGSHTGGGSCELCQTVRALVRTLTRQPGLNWLAENQARRA